MTKQMTLFKWEGSDEFGAAVRDVSVEVSAGAARLHRREVLADEIGDCNGRDVQPIDSRIWARKDFQLDSTQAAGARVSLWVRYKDDNSALTVELNGHPQKVRPVAMTDLYSPDTRWVENGYWEDAWHAVEVPVEWLRVGLNSVILRTEDASDWETLIEVNSAPNRSARSLDGGLTWDYNRLGFNSCYDGEFLIRLELDRHPALGRLVSAPFDLARSDDGLGYVFQSARLSAQMDADTPAGTSCRLEFRAGPTPEYQPARWSAWQPAASHQLRPEDRFVQWRANLRTERPLATPVLRSLQVIAELDAGPAGRGKIVADKNPAILRPSRPFGFQAPTARAIMLRERWRLDEVVAGAKDDYEGILRLGAWTRQQWIDGWNRERGALHLCPSWDAPLILEIARSGLSLGMCTHYSTVFVAVCAAMGIPSRHLILKCHCTAEAWSDHWGKWVWMDAGGDMDDKTSAVATVERNGEPLSALEVRNAWVAGQMEGLRLAGFRAEQRYTLWKKCQLLERFFIPTRNDYMTSLSPGEPEHGAIQYQYDGYLWWRDAEKPPLPWFSHSSNRLADFYWTPNRTRIHLQRTSRDSELRVLLESSMPNLTALQAQFGDAAWNDCESEFIWKFKPGANSLQARSVNGFGVDGPAAKVKVEF